jgi:hypothetical protein
MGNNNIIQQPYHHHSSSDNGQRFLLLYFLLTLFRTKKVAFDAMALSESFGGPMQAPSLSKSQDTADADDDHIKCYLPLSSHADDNPSITVYNEAKDMLLSAILTYGVVHLRRLARKQLSQQQNTTTSSMLAEQLLFLPIEAKDVVRLVAKYRDDIVQEIGREDTVDLYLNAFDAIQSDSSSHALELEMNSATFQVSIVSFDVVVVDDDNADNELVYSISVDTSRRRITVAFRGCSTRTDWLVCANTLLKEVDNPVKEDDGTRRSSSRMSSSSTLSSSKRRQPSKICIHSGYYNYLFSPLNSRKEDNHAPIGTDKHTGGSKFDAIIGHLQSLMKQYPGYQIYVTGHSLGAALATVFTFHAAASGRLESSHTSYHDDPPTITCINFASPMVGNYDFETAFRELEDRGQIRCLRVTNYYDLFTQLPDRGNWLYVIPCVPWIGLHLLVYFGFSIVFFLCFQTAVYRHVGMDLHMYRGRKAWIWCGENSDKFWYKIKNGNGTSEFYAWRVAQDFKKHMKQLAQRILSLPFVLDFDRNHRAVEHLERLTGLEHELKSITLKELYTESRSPPTSPSAESASAYCLV